jgi:hypothetical protein
MARLNRKPALIGAGLLAAALAGFLAGGLLPRPTPALVPGSPLTVKITYYHPTVVNPTERSERTVQDQARISRLLRELNTLPRISGRGNSCPKDDGSYYELVFFYERGDWWIHVGASGCAVVYLVDQRPQATALSNLGLLDDLRELSIA